MTNENDNQTQTLTEDEAGGVTRRQTATPTAIALSDWKAVLARMFRTFGENNLGLVAAGMSFFTLLALFPAIGAFVALFGLFLDPETVVQQLSQLRGVIPSDVLDILINQMRQLASGAGAKLTIAAVFSLLVALWGTRMGTNALIAAFNVAYREREDRGLIRLTLFSLLLALAIILGLICMALLAIGVPIVFRFLGLTGWLLIVARVLGIALAAVVLVSGLAALYRCAPDRRPPQWRWVGLGAFVVMLFWVLGSLLFSLYLGISNRYSAVYGSLGTIIILLTWIYITALIMLTGGVLNAELEHQTAEDTTVGSPRPMGERGAYVADHSAAAPPGDDRHDDAGD